MAKKSNEIKLSVSNLAQIREGSVSFGDFTLIVGAQASGKSLFLQMLKLIVDRHQIYETLELHAYDWGGKFENLLNMYFGESMSGIWKSDTSVTWEGKNYNSMPSWPDREQKHRRKKVCFIFLHNGLSRCRKAFPDLSAALKLEIRMW